ncbi:hypothetical protein [Bradyrhizobium guangzhouense]|uniref:DUF4397 domain-containing protein n=1 Tax=Bradyrhizobium guangzhouense TaxID=1325095 RepID=A0AAE5WVK1_9BRAD|nr:hypothetical protein [Bradyrhizobium guangzhouense]QAU43897.1 hypothetical protein XH91_00020 [Bradyrhizobium guangzhouense]RXH17988.1 hypothetical protein EAS56_02680 [Bradyrhizobium guangzhouense]
MTTVRRGTKVPARWRLFVCGLALLASGVATAGAAGWTPHLPLLFSSALTPDPDAVLPAPTRTSYREIGTTKMLGIDAPLRTRLTARIPAGLGEVLAFYRTELGKLGWQEQHDGADIASDHVRLAFTTPLGPAALALDRKGSSTSVNLVQRNREAAILAHVMPRPGRAALMFTNLGNKETVLTLDNHTVTLPARTGKERPEAPLFNVPPGKYAYVLKIDGEADRDTTIELAAGDAWEVTVGPEGDLWSPLQLY